MRFGLLLLFLAVPLAEIALLIQLSHWIGTWQTVGLVIVTAIAGTFLLRQQGLRTLLKATDEINSGKAPVVPVVEGVLLLIAGAFLLTPGVITDAVGALVLIPPVREALAKWAVRAAVDRGFVHVTTGRTRTGEPAEEAFRSTDSSAQGRARPHHPGDAHVIEGEFERLDETTMRPKGQRDRRDPD